MKSLEEFTIHVYSNIVTLRGRWQTQPQGDHPTPGRGQAIAPTMDEPGKPIRSIVGAHPCGRPAAMDEPGKPLRSIVGAHPCGRPAVVALPRSPYFLAL